MIRCNGDSSGRRATSGTRTLVGEINPSAPRGKPCSRCVREYCGNVERAALATLTALPKHHAMQNLDVRGTDPAQTDGQSKPLVPKALEDSGAVEQPPCSSEPALS